jgi:septal ring factor EnvC (AmiA/AmiB activator)
MSEPNERDRAHADVQALMREEAARRELNECQSTLELERAEMGRLRAEVERLEQELVDMTHKHRNQCDATDRQTEELAGAEAEIRGLNAELDAERERLRSLPDRMWRASFLAGRRRFGDDDWTRNVCAGMRWARRWLRREVGRG